MITCGLGRMLTVLTASAAEYMSNTLNLKHQEDRIHGECGESSCRFAWGTKLRMDAVTGLNSVTHPRPLCSWCRLNCSRPAIARGGLRDLGAEARRHVDEAAAREDIAHLLHRQHWLLTNWRAEGDRLTYWRFFNITGLIGVRVEEKAVFDLIHARPLAMVRAGEVDGLPYSYR